MKAPYICREIELVQTIIFLAGNSPSQKKDNTGYCKRLEAHFRRFSNHPVVSLTHEMIEKEHFVYIEPHRAALHLEKSIEDENDIHHEWAVLIKSFADESGFDAFLEKEEEYFGKILGSLCQADYNSWVSWVEEYFGCCNDNTNLIVCLLDGSYGFSTTDGISEENYIIRCLPWFDKNGNEIWPTGRLANGIVHEYVHTFVNPVVEANAGLLKRFPEFFTSHTNMFSAYNVDYAIINEYLVRACTIFFLEERAFEDLRTEDEIGRHRENFPFIEQFIQLMRKFDCKKESFETYYCRQIEKIISSQP